MLLSENPEHESNYTPMQFENSLGNINDPDHASFDDKLLQA